MKIKLTIVGSSFMRRAYLTSIMKTFIFLFCTTVFSLNVEDVFSQEKVKIDEDQLVTVDQVFKIIQKQTKYDFIYPKRLFKNIPKIQLKKGEVLINDLLEMSLLANNMDFELSEENIVIVKKVAKFKKAKSSKEQDFQISGNVVDESGVPLPGANILEKGTKNGTQTDFDGKFSLNVTNGNATIVVSYLGFVTQEVAIENKDDLTVTLIEDTAQLDEVIVVGYGTQKQKAVTNAVAQVDGDVLVKSPVAALTNTLAGRLPGLTVTNSSAEPGLDASSIRVRGLSSNSNNGVLIVIDGVQNRDGINRLDPNDIESVTVLKDAAAAIYGARAAGGVILVTTKRGKSGKPTVNYSSNISYQFPIGTPEMADAAGFMTLKNLEAFRASNWDPNYSPAFTSQEVTDAQNGVTPSYDWIDLSYRETAAQQNHSISVRGGSEAVRYFVSARILDQESLFEADETGGNTQYNIRSNIDFKVSDRLDLDLDIYARQQDAVIAAGRDRIFSNAPLTSPLLEPYVNGDTRFPDRGRFDQNPLAITPNSGYNDLEQNRYGATIKFDYKVPVITGLKLRGLFAVDINTSFRKVWNTPYNTYVENPDGGDPVIAATVGGNTPRLNESFSRGRNITSQIGLNYVRSFGDHNIDALAQIERIEIRNDNFAATRDFFDTDQLDNFGGNDRDNTVVNGGAGEVAQLSYLGRIGYNYKEKYLAQFLFRYDGNYNLAPGEQFGFFPGVSLGWVASEESFFNIKPIDFLKVKASWGELGNNVAAAFLFLQRFNLGNRTVEDGATVNGVSVAGVPTSLTWETTVSRNIGIESRLFNNRLSLEINAFFNRTNDLIGSPSLALPSFSGINAGSIRENLGTMDTNGFEIEAAYNGNIGNDFQFTIGGNVAHATNEVVDLNETRNPDAPWQDQTGKPLGGGLWFINQGIFRTQAQLDDPNIPKRGTNTRLGDPIIQDTNGDGEITGIDRVRIEETGLPTLTFGIYANATYKNFDFDMLWQGASGSVKRLQTNGGGTQNALAYFVDNTWSPDNVNATYPAFTVGQDTDFFLLDNNYIRLKSVELGYTLPTDIISKIGLENVRLYISGYNLITIDSLGDLGVTDVEQNNGFGWDFPNLGTANFGINITF